MLVLVSLSLQVQLRCALLAASLCPCRPLLGPLPSAYSPGSAEGDDHPAGSEPWVVPTFLLS